MNIFPDEFEYIYANAGSNAVDYSSEDYVKRLDKNLADNFKLLRSGQLPKSYIKGPLYKTIKPGLSTEIGKPFWRDVYIGAFGFPLFAENWVKPLARWIGDRPVLEIMAGSGYFSYALQKYGCKVKATDNYSWKENFSLMNEYIQVENIDCLDAIRKYGKDVKFILCSWPYMDNKANECLKLMRKVNPKCRMIYVGEELSGCTANDAFFSNLEECYIKGFDDAVSNYRRWQSIHDDIKLIK